MPFNEQFMRGINRSIVKGCTSATAEGHFSQVRGQNENVFLDQLLFEEFFFEIRFYPHNQIPCETYSSWPALFALYWCSVLTPTWSSISFIHPIQFRTLTAPQEIQVRLGAL